MAEAIKEDILELPAELVEKSCGFSLDIGGSAAKLVYRSKQDYRNGKPLRDELKEIGHVRMVNISRNEIEQIIKFITENCDITEQDGVRHVNTTGVGGNFFKNKLEEELSIKSSNLTEFDCFVKAFVKLMKTLPKEKLLLPKPQAGIDEAKRLIKIFSHFAGPSDSKVRFPDVYEDGEPEENIDDFPSLLIMCGSGAAFMKVEESGSFMLTEGVNLGGRFFLGLCAVLTGIKDFHELEKMIAESDGRSVDLYASELNDPKQKDIYSNIAQKENDILMFPFGKAATTPRDQVKKGDIVQSALRTVCTNIAQLAHLNARFLGLKSLYFCGNMLNPPATREWITTELYRRNAMLPKEERIRFQFIHYGGLLGALGAYIQDRPAEKKESTHPESEADVKSGTPVKQA